MTRTAKRAAAMSPIFLSSPSTTGSGGGVGPGEGAAFTNGAASRGGGGGGGLVVGWALALGRDLWRDFLGILSPLVFSFYGRDQGHRGHFFLGKRCAEPGIQDLPGHRLRGEAEAEDQEIGVGPLPCPPGGLGIGAEGGPDAGDLVGGDAYPRPRPAEEHPLLDFPAGHPFRYPPGYLGPEEGLPSHGSKELHIVPPPAQLFKHKVSQ